MPEHRVQSAGQQTERPGPTKIRVGPAPSATVQAADQSAAGGRHRQDTICRRFPLRSYRSAEAITGELPPPCLIALVGNKATAQFAPCWVGANRAKATSDPAIPVHSCRLHGATAIARPAVLHVQSWRMDSGLRPATDIPAAQLNRSARRASAPARPSHWRINNTRQGDCSPYTQSSAPRQRGQSAPDRKADRLSQPYIPATHRRQRIAVCLAAQTLSTTAGRPGGSPSGASPRAPASGCPQDRMPKSSQAMSPTPRCRSQVRLFQCERAQGRFLVRPTMP